MWNEDVDAARNQAQALETMPQQDSAVPQAPSKPSDAPQGDWKAGVSALGVDPGWVVAVRQKLVETGKIGQDDISEANLADPEHRKWLQRQMNKANAEAAAAAPTPTAVAKASVAKPAVEDKSPTSANPQPAANTSVPVPSVLKPGHMPTGPLWQSTATPAAGGGWMPAGKELWWPPWPVTGGPISKPAVQTAAQQGDAVDLITGQARKQETGG